MKTSEEKRIGAFLRLINHWGDNHNSWPYNIRANAKDIYRKLSPGGKITVTNAMDPQVHAAFTLYFDRG